MRRLIARYRAWRTRRAIRKWGEHTLAAWTGGIATRMRQELAELNDEIGRSDHDGKSPPERLP